MVSTGVTAQLPFALMLEASRGQTSKVAARYGCSQWAGRTGLHLTHPAEPTRASGWPPPFSSPPKLAGAIFGNFFFGAGLLEEGCS